MNISLSSCTTILLFTLLAGCAGPQPDNAKAVTASANGSAANFSLTLLHINDHHSHLDTETVPLRLATAPGLRERINVSLGGFARVSTVMKELSATRPNPIKIEAGDAVTGDLYYSLTQGKADAQAMNSVCFDTFTLGNHEFDNHDAGLKTFLSYLRDGNCKTQVLSANTHFGPHSVLNPRVAPGWVKPYVVLERGGQKIGLVGITTADKTKNSSRPDKDTTFSNETATAQAAIDHLTKEGVTHIVLQTHDGYRSDIAMARKLHGVDVIIGGDSHTLLGPESMKQYGLTPSGPYPTMATSQDGKQVCIAQAAQYAYVVGELRVEFNDHGDVIGCDGEPHVLIGTSYTRTDKKKGPLTPHEVDAIKQDIARSNGILLPTVPDPQTMALLAPYKAQKEAFGEKVVATSPQVWCLRRVPGTARSRYSSTLGDVCNLAPDVQAHGGDVQQLVAEAFLQQGQKYFQADLSIQNAGGVRTDINMGPITVKDIYTILPFKNSLVLLKATGAEIKTVLEEAVDAALGPHGSTGAYPYSAGLRWKVDARKPAGERVSNLEIRGRDGKYRAFDLHKVWNVATISFLADGQDHYSEFGKITGSRRTDVGLDYAQTLLDYIANLPGHDKILRKLPDGYYSTHRFIE